VSAREQLAGESLWKGANDALAEGLSGRIPAQVLELPRRARAIAINPSRFQSALKRVLDVIIASLAMLFFAPVMLVVAVLIALDSQGPVLFRQKRLGLDGKPFDIFKFRTMTVLEDGADVVQVREGDKRVTRIGRFLRKSSIDELPQFANVLVGEMSLVGPRPHAIAHDEMYARLIPDYPLRQLVKPGITGWAQVNGFRGETPTVDIMRRRVDLDIWYAGHANAALDALILLRTPLEILRRRNAH
jgi:putative colanic acid biosynthesis UDP-glucose lipid carrier transferase